MDSKTIRIKTVYSSILETIDFDLIEKGLAGSSNLFAEYLNDYSVRGSNSEVAEFLQDNIAHLDKSEIEEILDNPDYLISESAHVFQDAIVQLMNDSGNGKEWSEEFIKYGLSYFDAWGDFYFFVNQFAWSARHLFIIRASSLEDAYEELTERFQECFETEEPEDETEDIERNGNGTPINTDYLSYVGCIKFEKP